ncbi:MAG: hypothetical protein GF416_05210 [Candidatus Altiarchaeales archaeon]|nr:hypothetical protein [Candidatus Altiarchaeales archaeon]MBD3416515.1 hypothetical protein [Candidatus Altiarchaeales archaeon]
MGGGKRGNRDSSRADYALPLVSVALAYLLLTFFQSPGYQYRNIRCIDYLLGGTLYDGQPECVQPPTVYLAGAVFSKMGMLQPLSNAFILLLNAVCLHTMLKLIGRADFKVRAVVSAVYCLLVVPLMLGELETAFACAFMMGGVYYFFKGDDAKGRLVSSTLLALALMSKVTVLSAVAALFSLMVIEHIRRGWESDDWEYETRLAVRDSLLFIGPLMTAFIIMKLLFPQFLVYTLLSHAHSEQLGYLEAITGIVGTDPFSDCDLFVFYVFTAGVGAYFLRSRDDYAMLYLVSSVVTFVARYKPMGTTPDIFGSKYVVYPLFFLILVVGRHLTSLRGAMRSRAAALLVVGAMLMGSFHVHGHPTVREGVSRLAGGYDGLQVEVAGLKETFDRFYTFLPRNRGIVLVNDEIYQLLVEQDTPIKLEYVENRNNPPDLSRNVDLGFAPGLEHYGAVEDKFFDLTEEEYQLARRIESGEFEMIFFGPKSWDSQINYAFKNASRESTEGYCIIFLPAFNDVKTIRHWSTMIFNETSYCDDLRDRSFKYAYEIFDGVCEKDQWAADYLLGSVMSMNFVEMDGRRANIKLSKKCVGGGDLIDRMHSVGSGEMIRTPALIFLVLAWTAVHMQGKGGKRRKKRS